MEQFTQCLWILIPSYKLLLQRCQSFWNMPNQNRDCRFFLSKPHILRSYFISLSIVGITMPVKCSNINIKAVRLTLLRYWKCPENSRYFSRKLNTPRISCMHRLIAMKMLIVLCSYLAPYRVMYGVWIFFVFCPFPKYLGKLSC